MQVPDAVAAKARRVGATRWLDDLPRVIADLELAWTLEVGEPFRDATEAFVAPATAADGSRAVVKIPIERPGDHGGREARVLGLAGDSCVRLLAVHAESGAMLLERLGSSLHHHGWSFDDRLPLLCDAAAQFWRPAPVELGLPTGRDHATRLAAWMRRQWRELNRPCSLAAIEHAERCAAARAAAHDDATARLLHGDVHEWNLLGAPDGVGWKLVDPDGLVGEPALDLGVLMREDPIELGDDIDASDPQRRARWLAERTGVDQRAIWEWGVVDRVATGLLCVADGIEPYGTHALAVADRLAELDASGRA